MAVEIPVVIDIEGAFADAAKRLPKAMAPLENSIEKLTKDLSKWQEVINKTAIDSPKWKNAAKNFQNISQAIEVAQDKLLKYTSNDGSIRRMNAALASLNRRWEEMGTAQKYDKKGALSSDAKKLWEDYKRITAEIEKSGKSLARMAAEEQALNDLAKQRAKLTEEGAKKRQYEEAILGTTVQTMRVLQEQARILSERLSRTVIGTAEYKKLEEQLQKVRAKMKETAGDSDNLASSLNRQTGVVGRLASQMGMYISVYSLIRFVKQIRDVTGELEYQRVALGHLIQDEEYGARLFEEIKARAIESPFRIKDLVTYTKQLAAFRVEQEELFSTMDRLADISAGLGVDMNRLILAYGQVRAASVLRGQELRQFTEAGIPLVDLLAEKFSELNGKAVRTADVFELISKRAVPFSMISEIFEDMTEKGGMFYKMQEEQAKTLTGRWEKLKDAFDIGRQEVGETGTFKFYNDATLKILNAFAKNLRVIPKLIEGASAAWIVYTIATTKSRIATRQAAAEEIREATAKEAQRIANIKGIKNIDAYTYAMIRQKIATNALARGFWKLWAAIIASPVGAILAAVSGIAAALLMFNKKTEEATKNFEELDKLIEDISKGLKDTARIDKLISRYETLASKTQLNDKEHQRLYQTMSLLSETFPEVAIGVDAESDALDVQIKKLKELNKAREDELRGRGEAELLQKRTDRFNAQKELTRLYRQRQTAQATMAAATAGREVEETARVMGRDWDNNVQKVTDLNKKIAEQETLLTNLDKRIIALNRILHPESTDNTFNAWQRQIRAARDLTVGDFTSQIFTDDEIEKWETLDVALAAIEKRKQEVQKREDELSKSVKNQTGEIREQIQAELDWARAERLRLQLMEDWFKTPSVFAKDIKDNFRNLLAETFDEGNLKQYGQGYLNYLAMQTNIIPDPQLLARPLIDAAKLVEKGWEDAGDGIATVFSSVYDWEDKQGNKHNIMVTPILPDGSVLSPEELAQYVREILESENFKDEKGILLGVDVSEDAGERLHQMQEEYYHLMQMREDLPTQFLITEKDLYNLNEASDVIALVDSKISAIEKELESVKLINVENFSEEEISKTENYKNNLKEIYSLLLDLRNKFKTSAFSDIAQDIMENFNEALGHDLKGAKGYVIPIDFMISDKELQELYNVGDLFDLLDKKIAAIEQEIEKVNKTKIEEGVSDEVIESAELYAINLERVLNVLRQIEGRYRKTYSELAQDVQSRFPTLIESTYKGLDKESFSTKGLFSEKELKGITTVVDLYDSWATKLQAVNKAIESNNKKLSETLDLALKQKILASVDSLEDQKKALEEMGKTYGFVLVQGGKSGGGTTQDPWIMLFKNRMKFMQDFQKGVEDMDKYLVHSASLAREQSIMKGRGLSLGIKTEDLLGTPNELREWYDKAIKSVAEKIRSMGGKEFAGLGVTEILAKDLTGRKIQKYQELLQELWKGLTDFDTNKIKQDLEDALERLSEEIKRSEQARDLFNSIFESTGDRELATNLTVSVYGDPGDELKKRIADSISGAMEAEGIKSDNALWAPIMEAAEKMDFRDVMDKITDLPEGVQKAVKEAAQAVEKSNLDIVKSYTGLLVKYAEVAQRVDIIKKKAQKDRDDLQAGLNMQIAELESRGASPEELKRVKDRVVWAKHEIDVQERAELAKLKDEYKLFFDTVNILSLESARRVAQDQKTILSQQLAAGQIQLDEYLRTVKKIDEQLKKYEKKQNPFVAYLTNGIQGVIDWAQQQFNDIAGLIPTLKASDFGEGGIWTPSSEAKAFLDKIDKTFNRGLFAKIFNKKPSIEIEQEVRIAGQDAYNQAILEGADATVANTKALDAAGNKLAEYASKMNQNAVAFSEGMAWAELWVTVAGNAIKSLDKFAEGSRNNEEARENWNKTAKGILASVSGLILADPMVATIAGIFGGLKLEIEDAWDKFAEMNEYAMTGFERLKSGDVIGAGFNVYKSIAAWFNNARKYDREIKKQQDEVEKLEYSYDRLGVAIQDAFGSDYVFYFNQQMETLQAEAEAYRKMSAAEKGKKEEDQDPEKIKEYDQAAQKLEDKIHDMQDELSNFFAGTDIASAAKDFAQSWIEAYKTFGSTTGAMKQKFKDMIDNMVVNSLVARIVQDLLDPVFKAIDAASGGGIDEREIAEIYGLMNEQLPLLDASLNSVMQNLARYGISMRGTASGLSGIAKDFSGMTEETALGVAAGINTQNYYMSYMPTISQNVALIANLLSGGGAATAAGTTFPQTANIFGDELFRGQMSRIDQNIADLVDIMRSVRSVKSSSTNTHVIAVSS